jgi:hypothetical protein
MHWAKLRMPSIARCITAWLTSPLLGSRRAQAVCAVRYSELLTPSCCAVSFWMTPLPLGSGKFGTPCERMHWEKASGLFDAKMLGDEDPPPEDEATLATPGVFEPLHAAISRARPAAAMMAPALCL